eukprot:TRINITY_DN4739_c0_g1_i1.p1 TRINITY_DN4739_c0_g1~~TRINITY_DN4739_c0_g1_i1.p1  ORF type:complete len:698 (+),score=154.60 TRINITY_DN4739_c0_g1_i1:144-2237(+)
MGQQHSSHAVASRGSPRKRVRSSPMPLWPTSSGSARWRFMLSSLLLGISVATFCMLFLSQPLLSPTLLSLAERDILPLLDCRRTTTDSSERVSCCPCDNNDMRNSSELPLPYDNSTAFLQAYCPRVARPSQIHHLNSYAAAAIKKGGGSKWPNPLKHASDIASLGAGRGKLPELPLALDGLPAALSPLGKKRKVIRLQPKLLEDFCSEVWEEQQKGKGVGRLGTKPAFASFLDVILVQRHLVIPGFPPSQCKNLRPVHTMQTPFHPPKPDALQLPIVVMTAARNMSELLQVWPWHERVYEPSILFSFILWPQYGHALFNAITLLWEMFQEEGLTGLKWRPRSGMVRLYAFGDSWNSIPVMQLLEHQQQFPYFDVRPLDVFFELLSSQQVRSLAHLLQQSDTHPVCFSHIVAGLAGTADHLNFRAPLLRFEQFAMDIKKLFGLEDVPRVAGGKPWQRVVFRHTLAAANFSGLSDILPIDWQQLGPTRPRLVFVNRLKDRKILNIDELKGIANASGKFGSVLEVDLAEYRIVQQVELMAETDVLVAMDGTGLMNGIFMPLGAVVIHLRFWGCQKYIRSKGRNFQMMFAASPGRSLRWESDNRQLTVLPEQVLQNRSLEEVLGSDPSFTEAFQILRRSDTIIDPMAFKCLIETAHLLLHGLPVDWPAHRQCVKSVFEPDKRMMPETKHEWENPEGPVIAP